MNHNNYTVLFEDMYIILYSYIIFIFYVHATIPKGNMGYDQYIVLDTVAVKSTFVAFL